MNFGAPAGTPGCDEDEANRGLSRVHLARALEASLRRLGTDYIDLYQCHQWDPATPIEETMAALDAFVKSGKVRYLGCSNFTAAQIVEAQWAAQRAGGTPFISLQPQYSLLARAIEARPRRLAGQRRPGLGRPPARRHRRYRRPAHPRPASRSPSRPAVTGTSPRN
jgi:aryl-alcohol dehydrogenase-like predicted oxidoreductase